jgi:hypothetical protein
MRKYICPRPATGHCHWGPNATSVPGTGFAESFHDLYQSQNDSGTSQSTYFILTFNPRRDAMVTTTKAPSKTAAADSAAPKKTAAVKTTTAKTAAAKTPVTKPAIKTTFAPMPATAVAKPEAVTEKPVPAPAPAKVPTPAKAAAKKPAAKKNPGVPDTAQALDRTKTSTEHRATQPLRCRRGLLPCRTPWLHAG